MADGPVVGIDATLDQVREAIGANLNPSAAWQEFEFDVADDMASHARDADAPAPSDPPAAPAPPAAGGYLIGNLLRVLEHLALAPRSAPELAQLLQVDPRSCRRVLSRLVAEGYVEHDGRHRRRYRLTFRAASVAAQMLHASPLPLLASRQLEHVAAHGATAHLWTASPGGAPLSIVRVTRTGTGHRTEFRPASAAGDTPASRVLDRPPGLRELPTLRSIGDQLDEIAEADHARRQRSRCVVGLDNGLATIAAGVLQQGRVAAAVGVTNAAGTLGALAVVRAAQDLTASLSRFSTTGELS